MKTLTGCVLVAATILGVGPRVNADVPTNFPGITVSNYVPGSVGEGYIFLAVASVTPGVGTYQMILDNSGAPVWYEENTNSHEIYDFKLLANGHLHSAPFIEDHSWTGGGDAVHEIRNETGSLVETIVGGNGYVAESHDFQLLPNGHVLQFGYYMSEVDVSQFVDGGNPAARISGGVVQELNQQREVVWQWRSWDHFDFASEITSKNAVINAFHLNDIYLDIDNNLILGTPTEVRKINRQTGDVMWTLGGPDNDFTALGVGASTNHFGGHATYRLANGNFLMYDNGTRQGATSQVHEYALDEVAMTATLVWTWAPSNSIPAWHRGNAQRLPNGNTFIGWGGAQPSQRIPVCTEVTPAGQVVFELYFDTNSPPIESYRAFRFSWPPTNRIEASKLELAEDNSYEFTGTGVSLQVVEGGGGYNELTVTREPYSPLNPVFPQKSPLLLPVRIKMQDTGLTTVTAEFSFDAASFGFSQPTNLTVYHRTVAGSGIFIPQVTVYNPVVGKLQCLTTFESSGGDCGEFAFGFADVADVAYPPLLADVENYRGVQTHEVVAPKLAATGSVQVVNQELPILLSWSPKGFARWYSLQIATNQDFANPVLDVPYQTEALKVWSDAASNTLYSYRVRSTVENPDGSSSEGEWSTGAFQTAAPMVAVTTPNGGEAWQRGLKYFVQWQDNLAEDVIIDLYKGGVFLKSLATNSSAGALQWEVDFGLAPGSDYTIRVTSATDPALYDSSDADFSIGDTVAVTISTDPAGLTVSADGTNYTAPAVFNWVSGSTHELTALSPQEAPDGHSRSVFSAWNDGGPQTNLITVPFSATNFVATFTTQYRLDTSVFPAGSGTISNSPVGPWYDAGQLVSLTARTNSGYRFQYWQGADGVAGNTAQITMNEYHTVQATFQPSTFPVLVVSNSSGVAPGQLIGNIAGRTADGTRTTYVILDNTGTNIIFSSTNSNSTLHRFVTPQGFDAVGSGAAFQLKDETLAVVGSIGTVGYTLDTHDIEIWPNGHTLLFAQEFRTFDMSQVVTNGKLNANVTGNVIQELDANKRVVFEWHTFDHIDITNTFADMTQSSFDYAHINNVTIDPTDNNLLASLRTTSEIIKINRQTGEVMWHLGGKQNQFTFIGEHEENAPYYTVGQHDVHRLANGNLLYFDNGNISGGGITESDRNYTRMVEYQLDETNKIATLVWEYRHTPDIQANCTGSLKRMANGNTFIDWGCAVSGSGYIVTEVNPAGEVVFEMKHWTNSGVGSVLLGGGLLKQLWNSPDLIRSTNFQNVQAGQTYTSALAGVSVAINNLTGPAENGLLVKRHLDAVRFPQFPGKAPQVVMERIVLSGSNLTTVEAALDLDLPDTSYVFDTPVIQDPTELVIYHRPTPGQGMFTALPTTYDLGTQKLQATTTQLGEFVFGYPDLDEVPLEPVIASPADGSDVNQAAPVTLAWKPQGLVSSFDLQVATNADFASLLLDTNGLGSTSFALSNALLTTEHFWRVRVVNQGGTSEWVSASFTTVPPLLQLTYPAGGELWQRFQVVTITWNDNLSENVALDIYKGGVSNRNFAANIASSGSYTWTVGQFQAFTPGSDYQIKIRSRTNPALYDFSEYFSIVEPPTINASSITRLEDGGMQFSFTAPGAAQATVLGSTNLSDWQVLETLLVISNTATFTDHSATNHPERFYRIRLP